MRPSVQTFRVAIAITVASLALLGFVAPAHADPGNPGLNDASAAVYRNVAQDVEFGALDPGGNTPLSASGSGSASAPGSLAFTGLAAPVMLLIGLALVAAGATLRLATRGASQAGPLKRR